MMLYILKISVIFLFCVYFATSSYINGTFDVGERYNDYIYSTKGFNVVQLPYGGNYAGLSPYGNNVLMLIDQQFCPNATCSDNRSSIIVSLDLGSRKINTVFELQNSREFGTLSTYGFDNFQSDGSGNVALLFPKFGFASFETPIGQLNSNFSTRDSSHIFARDTLSDNLFLFSISSTEMFTLSLSTLQTFNNSNYHFNSSEFAFNQVLDNQMYAGKNFIFIACYQNGQNALIIINAYGFISSLLVTQDIVVEDPQIASIFEGPKGGIYVVVQSGQYNETANVQNAAVLQYDPDMKLIAAHTVKNFRWFAGHFFSGSDLYIYSYGSQIFRFSLSESNTKMTSNGVMTLSSSKPQMKDYDPIYNPNLMPILGPCYVISNDTNEVVIVSQKTGILFQVHLSSFCNDGEFCGLFYPVWAIGLICGVIGAFFITVIIVVVIKYKLRKRKRIVKASLLLHSRRGSSSAYNSRNFTAMGSQIYGKDSLNSNLGKEGQGSQVYITTHKESPAKPKQTTGSRESDIISTNEDTDYLL